jgi:small subunit ribosomal protein S4
MGDPRRLTAKYKGPVHPWQKERIEEEKTLIREYGMRNKSELWKLSSKIKDFGAQAKKLIALTGDQADLEKKQLFGRLQRLGLSKPGAELDDVLGLTLRNLLDRRLQTLVHNKGLARSYKQARQFITHKHVLVGGKIVTSPNYIVPLSEEEGISIVPKSALSKEDHPEMIPIVKKPKKPRREPKKDFRRGRR